MTNQIARSLYGVAKLTKIHIRRNVLNIRKPFGLGGARDHNFYRVFVLLNTGSAFVRASELHDEDQWLELLLRYMFQTKPRV